MSATHSDEIACTKCKFFDDHLDRPKPDQGLCRFNPPVSQPSPESQGLWPVVSSSDWCGHFSVDSIAAGNAD